MAVITTLEYQTLLFSIPEALADMIEAIAPDSGVEKRYISSEGKNDDEWLGYLRNAAGVVDLWLLTFNGLTGLEEGNEAKGATGTFTKPLSVVMDYWADYHQGVDTIGAVGSETTTNTEREFLKKVFAIDLALEKKRGCLQNNIRIIKWDFRIKLRRFPQATTHWMSGIIDLEVQDIFLT